MQVKICGITHIEDALFAAQSGAVAVGFIFYPPSPRYIEPQKARQIIDRLPAHLVKVGVFVNEHEQAVKRIFDDCCLDMIQLHGDESPEYCRHFSGNRIIKALELKSEEELGKADDYQVAAILVDARHAGLYGGTGKTSNWNLASRLSKPVILSGGLNEDNVLDAMRTARPAALDINSGVERSPGRKDPDKIERIMNIIKTVDSAGTAVPILTRRDGT